MPTGVCSDSCAYDRGGVSVWLPESGSGSATYYNTGEACEGSPEGGGMSPIAPEPVAPPAPEPTGPCVTDSSGNRVCTTEDAPNCGYINGEQVCLDAVAADTCTTGASGSMYCVGGSPTPPAPDVGEPGIGAAPDGVVSFQPTDPSGVPAAPLVIDYYSPGTVGGSTTGSESGGGSDPGGDDGGGECTDDPATPSNECGAGGGGECPPGETCGFAPPQAGSGFDVAGEAQAVAEAKAALNSEYSAIRSEMQSMFTGLAVGAGSLPCSSFTFVGNEIPFCLSQFEDALSIIAPLLLAGATFLAAMIVMRGD